MQYALADLGHAGLIQYLKNESVISLKKGNSNKMQSRLSKSCEVK